MRQAVALSVMVLSLCVLRAQTQASVAELIGDYAKMVHGRRGGVDLLAIDLDVVRRELGRLDPSAIPVEPSVAPERAREFRRRVLTAFALEVAAIGSTRHASSAAKLVEWACAYTRSHIPLDDYDRAWQLAALSVIEGGIDSQALRDHVAHASPIFQNEPRLLLARGIVEEQFTAPAEVLTRTETAASLSRAREAMAHAESESLRASERALARFQEAAQHEALRGEALLRAGHVQLQLSRYDAAMATWNGLEEHIQEPALVFLLHLFRGIAYEGRARLDQSRASYRAALALSPSAHSATLRLAALSFRNGREQEAAALTEALMRNDDPRRDPWWSYYAADWRLYYPRLEQVRALLEP